MIPTQPWGAIAEWAGWTIKVFIVTLAILCAYLVYKKYTSYKDADDADKPTYKR